MVFLKFNNLCFVLFQFDTELSNPLLFILELFLQLLNLSLKFFLVICGFLLSTNLLQLFFLFQVFDDIIVESFHAVENINHLLAVRLLVFVVFCEKVLEFFMIASEGPNTSIDIR